MKNPLSRSITTSTAETIQFMAQPYKRLIDNQGILHSFYNREDYKTYLETRDTELLIRCQR